MARRRKKARTPKATSSSGTPGAQKALPSLPPGAAVPSAFTPEGETPPETYLDSQSRTPRDRQLSSRSGGTTTNFRRDVSPLSDEIKGGLTCVQWL